jgi:hypothetical protein
VVKVHVFAGPARFPDAETLLGFLHLPLPRAGAAGVWPSAFGREVGLDAANYDAGSIAFALSTEVRTVRELAADHPGSASWSCGGHTGHEVVIVYPPNVMAHPERCSLTYLGEFDGEMPEAEPGCT